MPSRLQLEIFEVDGVPVQRHHELDGVLGRRTTQLAAAGKVFSCPILRWSPLAVGFARTEFHSTSISFETPPVAAARSQPHALRTGNAMGVGLWSRHSWPPGMNATRGRSQDRVTGEGRRHVIPNRGRRPGGLGPVQPEECHREGRRPRGRCRPRRRPAGRVPRGVRLRLPQGARLRRPRRHADPRGPRGVPPLLRQRRRRAVGRRPRRSAQVARKNGIIS